MIMANYRIFKTDSREVLVIILSLDMTQEYWAKLQNDINELVMINSTVYLDFLYRNGSSSRFMKTSFNEGCLDWNAVLSTKIPATCQKKADIFFYENYSLYKGSVISEYKRQLLYKRIQNFYNL